METLTEWIITESEYQRVAHETVYGFQETNKLSGWRTYQANTALEYRKICEKKHRDIFKNMNKQQRWETVKIQKL